MSIKIYNTLTRRKEDFETLQPNKVLMYVCGPTVYDKAHVGHAMSVLVFDVIRRYLAYRGYEVRHVMNYTDVDDKIIQRANLEGVDPFVLAERYMREFDQHLKDLNVLPATVYPRATQEIDHIIEMVQGLIEKGYATKRMVTFIFKSPAMMITASSLAGSWKICKLDSVSMWMNARSAQWILPCGRPPSLVNRPGEALGGLDAQGGTLNALR